MQLQLLLHRPSQNPGILVTSASFPCSHLPHAYLKFRPEDFMRKYMWPNSCLPSATALITAANTGSEARFTLEGVENHAAREIFLLHITNIIADHGSCADYPRTLREWGRRLDANVRQDLIVKDYPSLKDKAEFDAFRRKWQYLFAYAGAGFAKGYITCHMLTFTRPVSCPTFFWWCIP